MKSEIVTLSEFEVIDFFNKTISDFPSFREEEFRIKYSHKLSAKASFVVMRNIKGDIVAMIAAYINNPPLCYLSHVSVLDDYNRNNLFSRMLSFFWRMLKSIIIVH